jgi:tRNA (adenine22-N1)-methyltransferase
MQLSQRLQAVADLVTPGIRVADVGCDHAYIPIYLAENDLSPHIVAMDINQGPVDRAKVNIIKYSCEDRIEARRSDGLSELNIGEADAILIAGMGGALTIQILSQHMEITKSVRELVLQPQSEIHKVREFLQEKDFLIIAENMVKEDGKYYFMMKAVPQSFMKDSKAYILEKNEHFYYGRLLLEAGHPVLKEFLHWDLSLCEGILLSLADEDTENSRLRREEIKERMDLDNCGLGYFND